MGGYSYRMFTGAFVMMDGVKLDTSWRASKHLVTLYTSAGYMVIPSQYDLKQELFHIDIAGVRLDPTLGSTVELHDEFGNWHTYIAKSEYRIESVDTGNTPTSRYIASNYATAEYILDRVGIKFDDNNFFAIVEYLNGHTQAQNKTGRITSVVDAIDYSVTVGKYCGDGLSAYMGHTKGQNLTAKTNAEDMWVGGTKRVGSFTASLDYHVGYGQGWMRYDATPNYKWNSFVVSTTYQF
jgi:hypothetical protein